MDKEKLTFERLISAIHSIDSQLKSSASRAVNLSLTLRNWLIGLYVEEFALHGADRAAYGVRLFESLSTRLSKDGLTRVDERELRRYRQLFKAYPQIWETASPELRALLPSECRVLQEAALSLSTGTVDRKRETVSPELRHEGRTLLKSLSFSHFAELLKIDDPLKRVFYEYECIRGNWSVRELRRQIGSLYFERSHLSKDKEKLKALVKGEAETVEPTLNVRDPYIFEFLGLQSKEVMSESVLEDSLLDKLQDFLLELGHGFCFEARQKGILIGERRYYIDLVFYHRILKCHVLIELKTEEFTHEHIGQLNTYVSWYAKNEATEGDNPPVGILLCTQKDQALIEYALAGMDERLFISKYQLNLPDKEDMKRFLLKQMREK